MSVRSASVPLSAIQYGVSRGYKGTRQPSKIVSVGVIIFTAGGEERPNNRKQRGEQ